MWWAEKMILSIYQIYFPDLLYPLKVNNRNIKTRCEICSKSAIKTPERRQWHLSGVFIFNFEHNSHLAIVFLLLTLNMNLPTGLKHLLVPEAYLGLYQISMVKFLYK